MNNEHAELLIAAIESESVAPFGMRHYFTIGQDSPITYIEDVLLWDGKFCGTAACIAGTAALLSGKRNGYASVLAQEWLGLTYNQGSWLFNGHFSWRSHGSGTYEFLKQVSKAEAIAAIRWLMAGESIEDWVPNPAIDQEAANA